MHYYIFLHVSFMFNIPNNNWFWFSLVFSSLFFLVAMFIGMWLSNFAAKVISIIASIYIGFLFILLFVLIGYDILRQFIEIDIYLAGRIIIISVSLVIIFGIVNAEFVRVRKIQIPAKGLNKNLRIVQLSDLHLGTVHGIKYLNRIVRKTIALKPDIVLITGDLADGPHKYTTQAFSPLNIIKAPIYFTTGNHEYYAGLDLILGILSKTKVKILRNEKVDIGNIQLVGLDDTQRPEKIKKVLKKLQLDPKKFTILMSHRPIGFKEAVSSGVDLMLSGHTHGGQFFPFIMFAPILWRYNRGLYKHKGSHLYVTTGTGTWGPPFRLGTSSEITLIRLVNKESSKL